MRSIPGKNVRRANTTACGFESRCFLTMRRVIMPMTVFRKEEIEELKMEYSKYPTEEAQLATKRWWDFKNSDLIT